MSYLTLPPFGFIAAILALIPLPRQVRVCNIATIALSLWLFGWCIIVSVNLIVWAGNVNNPIPVWCDITSRYTIAANFGLPAATFCICRHLEHISSGRSIISGANRSRRIFEVIMCFVMPCFWIFVFYCFQVFRFVIVENFGCFGQPFPSYIAIAVVQLPPLLLSVGTLIFGCVAFYHLIRNRRMNADILATHLISRDALLSSARYYRLMAMSMALGIWGVVWISISVWANIAGGSDPLPSWKAIHSDDSAIVEVPILDLTPGSIAINIALWWDVPSAAYLYFLLFGSSREVLSDYQSFWIWFKTRVLRQRVPVNSSTSMNPAGSGLTESVFAVVDIITIDDQRQKCPKEELPFV